MLESYSVKHIIGRYIGKNRYITDLILAVVRLLERDMNQLVVEAREALELVEL